MPNTLRQMELAGEIDIHSDILSVAPSAISTKRALKVGRAEQTEMSDEKGVEECLICNPEKKEPHTSPHQPIIDGCVWGFINDYPYLPRDQWVFFLWHDDPVVRHERLHRYRLRDFSAVDLYWLLRACIEQGRAFGTPKTSADIWRMVVGFNLGALAGQSIPHFHVQYGWEVALNPKTIKKTALALYFEELAEQHLIINDSTRVRLVAPWTPKGQHAVELYFKDKYEFRDLEEIDLRIFAVVGEEVMRKYLSLGIQNVNIVFTNSPEQRETEPLVAHFVPRVNMAALYEIRGVNVVDTPPRNIAVEFTKLDPSQKKHRLWQDVIREADTFDPAALYRQLTEGHGRHEVPPPAQPEPHPRRAGNGRARPQA